MITGKICIDVEVSVENEAALDKLRDAAYKALLAVDGVGDVQEVDEDLNNDEE